MNEPIAHHYIPIFYLDRWTGKDGQVCRFSRPYGPLVKAEPVVPKGTGFEPRLYETRGLPPERAQTMEKDFMAKLDNNAAAALELLESGLPKKDWAADHRSSWSRFMLTQMLRAPEDIAQLKSSVNQAWEGVIPELEEAYAARRSVGDPLTVQGYIQQHSKSDEFAFSIARTLMSHSRICQSFNNMHWLVLDMPNDAFPLLTSDRPIWMTETLAAENAFISMPIGPRKLFTATVHPSTQRRLIQCHRSNLAKAINKIVVEHAVKYVYGQTDSMLSFIQKYMATKRHSSLLERLAAFWGHEIVAADSPMKNGSKV